MNTEFAEHWILFKPVKALFYALTPVIPWGGTEGPSLQRPQENAIRLVV